MISVELVKYHLGGPNEGKQTSEVEMFPDWGTACEWAGSVTEDPSVPYVVLQATNIDNVSQKEHF